MATIVSEERDAGSYESKWDTRTFANGSYIVKLSACGETVSKVVEVIK